LLDIDLESVTVDRAIEHEGRDAKTEGQALLRKCEARVLDGGVIGGTKRHLHWVMVSFDAARAAVATQDLGGAARLLPASSAPIG
jgi:hypothetical protein